MGTVNAAETGHSLFAFDNSYARDLEGYCVSWLPTSVPDPKLAIFNEALARELGLDSAALVASEGVKILGGNCVPPGATPVAQAYAGHQFGQFSPRLGDGRALLLGEIIDTNRNINTKFLNNRDVPFLAMNKQFFLRSMSSSIRSTSFII